METANARVASTPLSVGGTGLCTEALNGRFARLTDGIRRALGHEPQDYLGYGRGRCYLRLGWCSLGAPVS